MTKMKCVQKFIIGVLLMFCEYSQSISALNYTGSFLTVLASYNMSSNETEINLSHTEIADIPDLAFFNNSDLTRLDLSFNLLTFIRLRAFDGITCLKVLNLSSNYISVVPWGVFDDEMPCLSELDLRRNVISTIEAGAFALDNLQSLALNGNKLTSINSTDFAAILSLISLNVGNNRITDIASDAFVGMRNLSTLILRVNAIGEIKRDLFDDQRNLTLLDITNNTMEYLSDTAFTSLSSLIDLNVGFNRIRHVHDDTFNPLISLKRINLAFNSLEFLPNLASVSSILRELSFEGNSAITDIPQNYFKNFSNLISLSLSKTSLSSLRNDMLIGLSNVIEFKCESCPIGNRFRTSVFRYMNKLTSVSLSGAGLYEFPCISLYTTPPYGRMEVNVGENKIKNISEECIDSMINYTDIRIKMGNSGLTDLTMFEPILDRLTYLDVERNNIDTYFPAGSYSWVMKNLNLWGNRFTVCPDFHQELRIQLEILNITGNKMHCLDFHHMNNFTRLDMLLINENILPAFPVYGCDGYIGPKDPILLPLLKTFVISGNKLHQVPDLTAMPNLDTFDISKNQLQALEMIRLNGLNRLKHLRASENQISEFPDFREMGSIIIIEDLRLDDNTISRVPWNRIQPLQKLKTIRLATNRITDFIPDYSLPIGLDPVQNDAMLTSIRDLELDNNHLRGISDTVLRRMTSLQTLNIRYNLFASFQNMSYHYMLPPALTISLVGNPLRCNDEMCWLKDTVDMGNVMLNMDPRPCVDSPNLTTRLWASITKRDLECYKIVGRMWKDAHGSTMYGTVTAEVETMILLGPDHRLLDIAAASSEDCAIYCDQTEFCQYIYFDPETPLSCALISK